jgi:signal transduction histidine kinase
LKFSLPDADIQHVEALAVNKSIAPSDQPARSLQKDPRHASREQLRALYIRANSALERERLLIARKLHDEFAQKLTAASIELCLLDQLLTERYTQHVPAECFHARIQRISHFAKDLIKTTGKLCAELRPKILDELGLVAALQWQLEQFQQHTQIQCHFSAEPETIRLDPHRSTEIFRIAQEILLNVARHAHASEVHVRLVYEEGWVSLHIQDDGCGISEEDIASDDSLGLASIRERAQLLSGEFRIDGIPADGTSVVVRIPS